MTTRVSATSPQTTTSRTSDPVLRSGSKGAAVKTLQTKLKAAGFDPGPIDGSFGPKTKTALLAFQRANGLVADGICGPKTWARLNSTGAAKPPASTSPSTGTPTLKKGAKGAAVTTMQTKLREAGFSPGAIDGSFGPATQKALIAFQRANGLAADGVCGPKTWAALNGTRFETEPPRAGGKGTAEAMVRAALSQQGDRYIFGAEVKLNDPNPSAFDCSELVEWAVAQAGGKICDGSQYQRKACRDAGLAISVEQALRTPGALLFTDTHVAISLGDGRTIEARGSKYGVGIFSAHNRGWKAAGLVPGLKY
jgi:peptidoglycan hydrolase-like protein with peptidoglycan-binding domain